MLQLNFTTEEWKHTPEVATILYAAFARRRKADLRSCIETSDLLLVARHYGHVAGFAMFRVPTNQEDWPMVSWLAVAKCFRRWRVGTTIMNYIYDNLGKNIVSVWNSNTSAIKFYEKLGYIKYVEEKYIDYSWYYRR